MLIFTQFGLIFFAGKADIINTVTLFFSWSVSGYLSLYHPPNNCFDSAWLDDGRGHIKLKSWLYISSLKTVHFNGNLRKEFG